MCTGQPPPVGYELCPLALRHELRRHVGRLGGAKDAPETVAAAWQGGSTVRRTTGLVIADVNPRGRDACGWRGSGINDDVAMMTCQ